MPRPTVILPSFLAVWAALMLVLATAVPASAHSALVSSTPANGESLASMPTSATLVFNENIQPTGTQIVIADASDVAHPVTPSVDGPKVSAAIPEGLPPGQVHVRYRAVSADGHPISGEIVFAVTGGQNGTAGPGSSTAPGVAPAPTANPTVADGDGSTAMMYVLTGVAAVALVGAGIALTLAGRRGRR